jgi:hypothetical protein
MERRIQARTEIGQAQTMDNAGENSDRLAIATQWSLDGL